MYKEKKKKENSRNDFLLTFFGENDNYEVKEVNGFLLEKQIHAHGKIVAVYSKEAWQAKKDGWIKFNFEDEAKEHIRNIMQE